MDFSVIPVGRTFPRASDADALPSAAQHKKIAMGLSHVAGWGAFLREPARKGELIGEYTGELVGQEEADRRCDQ